MNKKFTFSNLKAMLKTLPLVKVNIHKTVLSLTVINDQLKNTVFVLKNHLNFQFKMLSCISGVDYVNQKLRFKIVYEMLSVRYNVRIRVQTFVNELTPVDSITKIFPAAGWYESEIWDMFGVFFLNNTNLTRLLTDYGFEGYPLRKDFPLSGFVESGYDYTKKQVLNSKIELAQEYKSFELYSPWETLTVN